MAVCGVASHHGHARWWHPSVALHTRKRNGQSAAAKRRAAARSAALTQTLSSRDDAEARDIRAVHVLYSSDMRAISNRSTGLD